MVSPRTRRLMLDEETLQALLQGWPLIQITGKAGIPPEIYRFTYNLRGLYVSGSGEILERDSHVLEVNLTLGYPRRAPQCRMLTPVFHPNFDDSMVCIGDFWAASEGLDQLIIRIGRMITYQEYNTKSPLNGLAAKWAAQNSSLLPIDSRAVAPPISDTSRAPAQQGADAPSAARTLAAVHVPGVQAPTDEQWSEKIVIAGDGPAIPAPDGLKIEAGSGSEQGIFRRWKAADSPTVSVPAGLTTEGAGGSEGGTFRRWKKVILISALLATLGGGLLWYVFHRQGKVATRSANDPSMRVRATAARRPAGYGELLRQSYAQLPDSSNSEALRAEQNARRSIQTKDYPSAITALKYAVSLDSNFSRAWIELGWVYSASADKSSALSAFQKAAEADPKQILPYKILAFNYAFLGNRDNAITTWQRVQSMTPDDPDIGANLGGLYMAQKRYSDAMPLFETAAKANPSDAYAQLRLGMVRLRLHDTDQGLEAMHKAVEIDSGAEMLNDVAYEMAEADTNLTDALVYSQRSVKEVEERSQQVDLENIRKSDLRLSLTIANYWDTLGWIYFKMDDLARAERYLEPAWQLGQEGTVGDHLGQAYEREQKLPAALHMYILALEANPRSEETAAHMGNLAHVPIPASTMSAGQELTRLRTVELPSIVKETASADFDVLFLAGGKIEKANFVQGTELFRHAGERLERSLFREKFPPNSTAHLVRRGMLSCSDTGCSFVFYSAAVAAN
jgi:tetratricopeptide (TPR) repeat protein/ubiquitin-protein ligase